MPRQRFERAAEAKRNALLDAAAKEFATHGYAGASINRILLAAGLSKGSFYYYFDDKADLAATVVAHETAQWIDSIGALPLPDTAEDWWEEMRRFNDRAIAEMLESPLRSDLLSRLGTAAARDPDLFARMGPYLKDAAERGAGFFRRGQEVGALRTDLSVETLMTIQQGSKKSLTAALLPADRAPTAEELAEFARINFDCFRRLALPEEKKQ
ncbi:MAG TPA: TetR/AcrR family transcriptional regulator [Polyangiaceae bacterium]|nr:TetR/AcrR family transcriptional regulator [Polyangiaceae bacterium]